MPRNTPKQVRAKQAARKVVAVVKKAKRKLVNQPSTAKLDAAFKRATSV